MTEDAVPSGSSLKRIDVTALLERPMLSAYHYRLLVLSCLITFFDGLDLMMISYTAPYLREPLGLSPAMLGQVFAIATVGQIIGGFVFTYLADIYGRRPVIIGTSFLFGVLTLLTALVSGYHSLLLMRFVNGIAIGGMLPIAWALNIESAPRRMRATAVTIIMLGYSAGAASAGPITNLLAPTHGWRAVFVAGGIATLVAATLLLLFLPESIRFMVSRRFAPSRIARALAPLDARLANERGAEFYLQDEAPKPQRFSPADLFRGELAAITPVLWCAYFASSLAVFFTSSWGPILLETLHTPRQLAALISAFSGILGAISGVVLLRATEWRGPQWIMLYPALAAPILLALGLGLAPQAWFYLFVIVGGLLVSGGHAAVVSIAGLYYPSAIRANGAGWATSVAKIGGIIGPLVGGALLSSKVPPLRAYAALAICPALVAVSVFVLSRIVAAHRRSSSERVSHG